MADFDAIFKAYDIRGITGEQIDSEACAAIGAAFARHVATQGHRGIVIGRDMRPDGAALSRAFAQGAAEVGVEVTDIGLCATEMVYFASGDMNLPGAMFTASHNPVGYNGIKLCGAGAAPIGAESGLREIKSDAVALAAASGQAQGQAQRQAQWRAETAGRIHEVDVLDRFVDHVRSFARSGLLDAPSGETSRRRPLRVVIDAGNGMAGLVAPAVLDGLAVELDLLYGELDGTFPNHPADPLQPENLADLCARVRSRGADVGLAFDGDADRVFLVDERGHAVSGSVSAALIVQVMLGRSPGATVVHNPICSRRVSEVIVNHGGRAVLSRVGHSFMKKQMAATGAVVGVEHSGHFYFRDNHGADSAMVAAVLTLEALAAHPGTLSDLVAPLGRYFSSGEINTAVSDPTAVTERVAAAYEAHHQERFDGLSVDCGQWWFNLRPSNTEPLLRLNLEATTPEGLAAGLVEVRSLIEAP